MNLKTLKNKFLIFEIVRLRWSKNMLIIKNYIKVNLKKYNNQTIDYYL